MAGSTWFASSDKAALPIPPPASEHFQGQSIQEDPSHSSGSTICGISRTTSAVTSDLPLQRVTQQPAPQAHHQQQPPNGPYPTAYLASTTPKSAPTAATAHQPAGSKNPPKDQITSTYSTTLTSRLVRSGDANCLITWTLTEDCVGQNGDGILAGEYCKVFYQGGLPTVLAS
ncbi:uncharacterized protein DFL_001430 [Arthrobotrys flagrans]|uniref:Uncharacterized protein n=1 Tax=Arthrobotrys flagrans TaxID=97331 RepID=A0A437A824_ARTFL|nr:hypothetical protein DFL_001430 [Arthrobotrys flagrans]